jgi:hypothetical protein
MADDEFDIDIYGDTGAEQDTSFKKDDDVDVNLENPENTTQDSNGAKDENHDDIKPYDDTNMSTEDPDANGHPNTLEPVAVDGAADPPMQLPVKQGVKRKEGSDDRPIDPGATNALFISDLHWWNTDDDIRGWVSQAQCEDELKDITFSEHKVNGKSKGWV